MEIKEPYRPGYCPHCGAKLANNRTDLYLYGSPVRTCEKCKGQYWNKCYHEAEIDGYCDADVSVDAGKKNVRNAVILLLAALALNVLFYVLERHSWIYLLFVGLGVVYFLIALKDFIKVKKGTRQQELEKERLASAARLSDPVYAQTLKELGYNVPEKYLPQVTTE